MSATQKQIEKLRTLQESYDELANKYEEIKHFAKQGDNPEATNSKILEEVQNKLTPLEAVLTELSNGKQEMVDALATKNVQSSTDKTLSAIADDVRNIAQNKTEFTGEDYSKAITYNGLVWDVVKVGIEDARGDYAVKIVVELYKTENTISLTGADAYATSDGYFYTNTITHNWTKMDDKFNRYVIYYYALSGQNFTIPADATSIVIIGNIGNLIASSPVRLERLCVLGSINDMQLAKEATLNLLSFAHISLKEHTYNFILSDCPNLKHLVIEVDHLDGGDVLYCDSGYFPKLETLLIKTKGDINNSNIISTSGRQSTLFAELKHIVIEGDGGSFVNSAFKNEFSDDYYALCASKAKKIEINGFVSTSGTLIYINRHDFAIHGELIIPHMHTLGGTLIQGELKSPNSLSRIYMPNLSVARAALFSDMSLSRGFVDLIDLEVGCMETNLNINLWNPINIITAGGELLHTLQQNVHNHIAEKVSDRTGLSALTITFSQNLRNVILPETEELFASKNWNIAPAKSV